MLKFVLLILLFFSTKAENQLSKNAQDTVFGNNNLGYAVYKKLAEKEGNIVYSALSTHTVLALTYIGARDSTAKEMSQTLHLTSDQKLVGDTYAEILPYLSKQSENFTLELVNKLYPEISVKISESFLKEAEKFNSSLENIDYSNNKLAAEKINKFISEKTHNKINNVIQPDSIDEYTKLILLNTIYFKAKWNEPFSYQEEGKINFTLYNGEVKPTEYISRSGTFGYKENNELDATILEVDYVDPNFAMYFVLPNKLNGLKSIENNLEKIENILKESFEKKHVSAVLPRFKIEYKSDLRDILEFYGMRTAFTDLADFSGMIKGTDRVQITKVSQKAFISVDHEGTEASAATFIQAIRVSADHNLKYFIATRPFLYFIQEKSTKTILFLGRLEKPQI